MYFEPDLPPGTALSNRVSAVLCFESVDGGWHWRFKSVVASNLGRNSPPYAPPSSSSPSCFTPSESNIAALPDGALLCVFRVRSPDSTYPGAKGPANGVLWRTLSTDNGVSWLVPRPAYSAQVPVSSSPTFATDPRHPHSVQPKLATLPNGVTLLASGRYGTFVWASSNQSVDAAATDWAQGNVAANHNANVAAEWHFPEDWIAGEWPAGGPSQPCTARAARVLLPTADLKTKQNKNAHAAAAE